jgi:hypothetical protein
LLGVLLSRRDEYFAARGQAQCSLNDSTAGL